MFARQNKRKYGLLLVWPFSLIQFFVAMMVLYIALFALLLSKFFPKIIQYFADEN